MGINHGTRGRNHIGVETLCTGRARKDVTHKKEVW